MEYLTAPGNVSHYLSSLYRSLGVLRPAASASVRPLHPRQVWQMSFAATLSVVSEWCQGVLYLKLGLLTEVVSKSSRTVSKGFQYSEYSA
jgi:hypothetical protein